MIRSRATIGQVDNILLTSETKIRLVSFIAEFFLKKSNDELHTVEDYLSVIKGGDRLNGLEHKLYLAFLLRDREKLAPLEFLEKISASEDDSIDSLRLDVAIHPNISDRLIEEYSESKYAYALLENPRTPMNLIRSLWFKAVKPNINKDPDSRYWLRLSKGYGYLAPLLLCNTATPQDVRNDIITSYLQSFESLDKDIPKKILFDDTLRSNIGVMSDRVRSDILEHNASLTIADKLALIGDGGKRKRLAVQAITNNGKILENGEDELFYSCVEEYDGTFFSTLLRNRSMTEKGYLYLWNKHFENSIGQDDLFKESLAQSIYLTEDKIPKLLEHSTLGIVGNIFRQDSLLTCDLMLRLMPLINSFEGEYRSNLDSMAGHIFLRVNAYGDDSESQHQFIAGAVDFAIENEGEFVNYVRFELLKKESYYDRIREHLHEAGYVDRSIPRAMFSTILGW